jgi:hypothetical protein
MVRGILSRWGYNALVVDAKPIRKPDSEEIWHAAGFRQGNVLLHCQKTQVAEVSHKSVGLPTQQELDLRPGEAMGV